MQSRKAKKLQRIWACLLAEAHAAEIRTLFGECLDAVEEALDAERIVIGADGEQCHVGPDHRTRLAGFRILLEFIQRSRRPPVEPPEQLPPVTNEELHHIRRRNSEIERRTAS